MAEEESRAEHVYRIALRRALSSEDASMLPLHIEVAVMERYRAAGGYSIIRTDTVGRVRKDGGWSLDFGIAPDETLLNVTVADLLRLPDADRDHWASFATLLPSSRVFLQMRLAPGACYDDGEVRAW